MIVVKGQYNYGLVKETINQRKKHISQMNYKEILYLVKKLKSIQKEDLQISNHLQQKEVDFSIDDIINILNCKNINMLIVEYNETPMKEDMDYRVLIRSNNIKNIVFIKKDNSTFEAEANFCFVISIKTKNIITAYWNKADDNHSNINWNRYCSSLQIVK